MARLYSRATHPIVALIVDERTQVRLLVISPKVACFVAQRLSLLRVLPDTEDVFFAQAKGSPDLPS